MRKLGQNIINGLLSQEIYMLEHVEDFLLCRLLFIQLLDQQILVLQLLV